MPGRKAQWAGVLLATVVMITFQNCGSLHSNKTILMSDDESLVLNPSSPLNANVQDSSQIQMNQGVVTFVLNKADSEPVTVNYITADQTAKAGVHYRLSTGSVTFEAYQKTTTVNVPVFAADGANDLTFAITITGVSKGAIGRATGKFTIARGSDLTPLWHGFNPANGVKDADEGYTFYTGRMVLRYFEYKVSGGTYTDSGSLKGFMLDPFTGGLRVIPDAPLSPRTSPSIAFAGGKLMVWGGEFRANPMANFVSYNDGAIYDPATNAWTMMNTVGAPSARANTYTVVSSNKIAIYGGIYYANGVSQFVVGGSVYDMTTNAWTAMPASAANPARTNSRPAVGGNRIYHWGGDGTSNGGIYDFATNTWTAMATAGAPSVRTGPTVSWVGDRLIVIGGATGVAANPYFSDGAMYNPDTGVWTAIDMTGGPLNTGGNFSGLTAIGNKFYLFGNLTAAFTGIFDPATNKWSAMNLQGAPSARFRFSKVAGDNKYFIFGGSATLNGAGAALGDGAVYNALTGTWAPLSTVGAPAARIQAPAFWTGTAFGVLGGLNGMSTSYFAPADGGIFY